MEERWNHFNDDCPHYKMQDKGFIWLEHYRNLEGIVDKLGLCRPDIAGRVLIIGPAGFFGELPLVASCPFCEGPKLRPEVQRVVAINDEAMTVSYWSVPHVNGWNHKETANLIESKICSSYDFAVFYPQDKFDVITMLRIPDLVRQLDNGLGLNLDGLLVGGGVAVLSGYGRKQPENWWGGPLELINYCRVDEFQGSYIFMGEHWAYLAKKTRVAAGG